MLTLLNRLSVARRKLKVEGCPFSALEETRAEGSVRAGSETCAPSLLLIGTLSLELVSAMISSVVVIICFVVLIVGFVVCSDG